MSFVPPTHGWQTYMLMIGASVGDLVQFVKTSAGRGNGKRGVPRKEAPTAVTATADDVLVSRVELDCRTYRHRKHWGQVVLPRLYEFARMVYRFRGDDLLRWRYLLATPVRLVVGNEWRARLMGSVILGCYRSMALGGGDVSTLGVCFVGLRTCCIYRVCFSQSIMSYSSFAPRLGVHIGSWKGCSCFSNRACVANCRVFVESCRTGSRGLRSGTR